MSQSDCEHYALCFQAFIIWLFCLLHSNLRHRKGHRGRFRDFVLLSKNENCPLPWTYLKIDNLIEGQLEKRMRHIRKQDIQVKCLASNCVRKIARVLSSSSPLSLHIEGARLGDCVCAVCLLGIDPFTFTLPWQALHCNRMLFWTMQGSRGVYFAIANGLHSCWNIHLCKTPRYLTVSRTNS